MVWKPPQTTFYIIKIGFGVVCGGLGWFAVVLGGLRWFAVIRRTLQNDIKALGGNSVAIVRLVLIL